MPFEDDDDDNDLIEDDTDDIGQYYSNEFTSKPPQKEGIFSNTINKVASKDRYGGNSDSDEDEMDGELEVICSFDETNQMAAMQVDELEINSPPVESGYEQNNDEHEIENEYYQNNYWKTVGESTEELDSILEGYE